VTEPLRFIGSKGLKAELLASAKRDQPPAGSRRRALLAAATAVATSTTAATATASLGTLARLAAWKWVAVGAMSIGTLVAAKAIIAVPATVVPESRSLPAAAPAERARQDPAPVPTRTSPPLPPEVIPTAPSLPPSLPQASPKTEAPIAKPQTSVAAAPATAIVHAPSAQPSSPGSTLSAEISAIDQAKRALASGEAGEALRQVDAYRSVFPKGILSAEASALRVEALVRAGRRDEARAELARLRAGHPDSPLLENLGPIVGE
jgi:hypothetical protein